ncbi:endonuclease domain-containing protein [Novosphingobium naphthalenivorans]|uniref:endonuclease domain-containing protein n=1 Tax=Novosphingobium naphthalenivorans TaxID=273168 RepID=UPI001FE0BB13|nr:DUF559 domain-containing protein [Novosphingobium naphthalenivorans]
MTPVDGAAGSSLSGLQISQTGGIGLRIVDFFCPAKGLIVEVDGGTHDRELDLHRDRALERNLGFRTVRFTNLEVMSNMEGVLLSLLHRLDSLPDRWRRGQ